MIIVPQIFRAGHLAKTHGKKLSAALLLAASLALANAAQAQFISGMLSVDFNSDSGNGANGTGNTPAGPASALGTVTTWKEIDAGTNVASTASNITLVTDSGAASNVTLSYTDSGSFDVYPYMTATERANSPNLGLLEDFIYTNTTTTSTVTLAGLSLNASYNLYLYVGGNSNGRATTFTIGSTAKTATFADADTTFVNGDNYVMFNATSSGTGTIAISYAVGAGGEGDFDGLQITPVAGVVPEPSSLALLGVAGLGAVSFLRRRKAAK